jgi:hypothetical protein
MDIDHNRNCKILIKNDGMGASGYPAMALELS